MLILVATQSKAWVCNRSLVGNVGSNPAGAWGFFVFCQCYVFGM